MHNLTIQLDNTVYTIPPEAMTSSENGTDCTILIDYQESLGPNIYIGLPFFENFVAVYNYPNGIVQFAVSDNAYAGANIG